MGHIGESKFYNTFKNYIYSERFKERIHILTQQCQFCQFNKVLKTKQLFTQNFFNAGHFNEKVCSDIIGPLNSKHFKIDPKYSKFYILTFIDVYSKAIKVYDVYDITSQTVVTCFSKYIKEFGKPESILTDNGTQYISRSFRKFCRDNVIQHNLSPRFTPQSNGLAERINFNINNILRIYRGYDIEFVLSRIHNYHNFSYHSQMKLSPFETIYYYNFLDPFKRDVKDKVKNNLEAFLKKKEESCKNFKDCELKIDDLVLVQTQTPGDKLELKYEGPYKIFRLLKGFNAVEIENSRIKRIESLRNIKPFFQKGESVVNTEKTCLFVLQQTKV